MMKPYPHRGLSNEKRIFNYRARRVVENAFGILANRFKVLSPEVVDKIVLAYCTLHNLLTSNNLLPIPLLP